MVTMVTPKYLPVLVCPRCARDLGRLGWLPPGFVACLIHGGRHYYRVVAGEFDEQGRLVSGSLVQTCCNLHDLAPHNTARVKGRSEPRCKQCNRDRVRQHRARRPTWSNTRYQTGHQVLR